MRSYKISTVIWILFGLFEWLSWTNEMSYLRKLFPFSVRVSFFTAVVLLAFGLWRLSNSSIPAEFGRWISFRMLTTPKLLRKRPSSIQAWKNGAVIVLAVAAFGLLLTVLPDFFAGHFESTANLTLAYFLTLLLIFVSALFVPQAVLWGNAKYIVEESTMVIKADGELIYVEDRESNTWRKASGPYALLIDCRARIFKIIYHLRRDATIAVNTPIFNGAIAARFNGRYDYFPEVFTANEMSKLEAYIAGERKSELVLRLAMNSVTHLFADTIKAQFALAAQNINLNGDPIATLREGFLNVMTSAENIDTDSIAEMLYDGIRYDIFGDRSDAPDIFAISLNVSELSFTEEFQRIRQTMLGITEQLAASNLAMQQTAYEKLLSMLPMIANSTLQDPAEIMKQFQQLISGIGTGVAPAPLLPPGNPSPAHSEISGELILQTLEKGRQFLPNGSCDDMKIFVERELRKLGLLNEGYEINRERFEDVFYQQA